MGNKNIPLVTIVIPIYNVEKYLFRCLDSALSQTLKNIEFICVEDASKDNSLRILDEYADKDNRIRIFRNECNKGLSYNRNLGIANARGKYVYFLDSDDTIELEAMSILYDAAEKYSADVVAFGSTKITDGKKNIFVERPKELCYKVMSGKNMFVALMEVCGVPSPAPFHFYRTEFLKKQNCTFLEGALFEDNLFTFQTLLKCPRMVCIDNILYNYYTTPGSIMQSTVSMYALESIVKITKAMVDTYQKETWSERENNMALKWLAIFYNSIFQRMRQYGIHQLPETIESLNANECNLYKLTRFILLGSNVFLSEMSYKILDLKKYESVIIYGAGKIGKKFLAECIKQDIPHIIIAVTKKSSSDDKLLGFDINEIDDVECSHEAAVVVIAAGAQFADEMKEKATTLGYTNVINYKELFN